MRHMKAGRTFNRDTNARKALFIGLAKNLIEKEQIKTTLPKAKDLRTVVEKMITRAKEDSIANRRLIASELGNNSEKTVKKLFSVLGPRYIKRPGGYTRVLKAGFRYGDAAPMAIIELVDRDESAKKAVIAVSEKIQQEDAAEKKDTVAQKTLKTVAKKENVAQKKVAVSTTQKKVAVKRRSTGK